jgi:hypothetical protein
VELRRTRPQPRTSDAHGLHKNTMVRHVFRQQAHRTTAEYLHAYACGQADNDE